jgi:DNA-binding CsgD family transcriptional regulator
MPRALRRAHRRGHAQCRNPTLVDGERNAHDANRFGIQAINALSTGLALLDRRMQVLFANATAERILKMPSIFKASTPLPLVLFDAESNDALRKAVAQACGNASAALQLRDGHAHPAITAVVLPLCPSAWSSPWTQQAVLLAMNESTRPHAIPDHWLSQMFGLTRAEASVTNWLISGRTIDAYAQHRGVSLETARSQLKAVLAKTGMSRQAQLVATLSRLPIEHASS